MGFLIILFLLIQSGRSNAMELPTEPAMRKVVLPAARTGKNIKVNFAVQLPRTQKLNPGAPSFFAVYEQSRIGWRMVKEVKLANRYFFGDVIELNEDIELADSDSNIALHSTIYHCGKDSKSACFIQTFQGTAKRKSNGDRSVRFIAHATVDENSK